MTDLLLASSNPKKLAELQRILGPLVPDLRVLGLADLDAGAAYEEPVEDGATFADNALIKARAGAAHTGLPTVADDSGLCVDALNGMPGVLSARWSGQPKDDDRNNRLLLEQLEDVPDERRAGHFACVIAFVTPDGREVVQEGRMDGRVIRECRGNGGFGYDVLFCADEHPDLTTAELSIEQKDAISHRGQALRRIAPVVAETLKSPTGHR